MTRNRSCTSAFTTQGQWTQQALKLACCLDALIGSLLRHPAGVKEEKITVLLSGAGVNFKAFLGFDTFYEDATVVREMTNAFSEALRLIVVHNACSFWDHDLQGAWSCLFHILLYYLDGIGFDDEDLH